MSRLQSFRPRLVPSASRISAPSGERERDRDRERSQPWRKWYHSAEWKALRLAAFQRDGYICQRSGVLCLGKGNDPDAPIANHKVPHRGDRDMFFDIDNIETVTKAIHDGVIQREEKQGRFKPPF